MTSTTSCAPIVTVAIRTARSELISTQSGRSTLVGLWKRGKWYWLDAKVHGHRYREPLGTTDWREAKRLERQRFEQLETKASVPSTASLTYATMDVATAIATYAKERRAQVSTRMVA